MASLESGFAGSLAAQQEKQKPSTTIEALIKAAEQGDAKSQYELAKAYLEGRNVQRSHAEAAKWFRKTADQGFAEAQDWLGAMYEAGLGVMLDYVEAAKWYRRAAEQGDASAQVNLGFMYQEGRNVPQSTPPLPGGLQSILINPGGVVLQDYSEAAKWYRRAAEQDNAFAQSALGLMHATATGVTKDNAEAEKWLRKAAEQGEISAQCILGAIYVEGNGVAQDLVQAHRWLNRCAAAAQGKKQEMAAKFRDEIAIQMNPQQIAEAQRLAKELDPKFVQSMGNGPYYVGGGVNAPVILVQPSPHYTNEARRARIQGVVLVQCIVRNNGKADRCKVLRGLGYGLEESTINTIEARWRFKPGTYNGAPVDVQANIEASFGLN